MLCVKHGKSERKCERKMTTVGDLREIIEGILYQIEGVDDDVELRIWTNTYFVNGFPLEVKDGFIDYENIEFKESED